MVAYLRGVDGAPRGVGRDQDGGIGVAAGAAGIDILAAL